MKLPKYNNADICKDQILSDNKNKAGIYKWKNKINNKCYIGSSENLSCRLSFYYSNSSMESLLKRSKSQICSALLKHGLYNFSLEIIEYCEPSKCLEREAFYLKTLKPEYNIAKEPGASMSGRKHSDESKQIISDKKKGQTLSNKTKKIILDIKKGQNHTDESKKKNIGC